jgi:hypothetical protein
MTEQLIQTVSESKTETARQSEEALIAPAATRSLRSRLARRVLGRVGGALLGTALATSLVATPAFAGSLQPRQFVAGGAQCSIDPTYGRTITVAVPNMSSYYGGIENVHWSPDLWAQYSTGWGVYDSSRPWYYGAAGASGMVPMLGAGYPNWYVPVTNAGVLFVRFSNLPRGTFAVKNYYKWDSVGFGGSAWSLFNGTQYSTCVFNS